jgi:hypothetical protein
MAKYANKETREDGSEVWLATDGREYKTKAGAYKHSKKLESEVASSPSEEATTEGDTFHGQAPPSEPEWVEMEYDPELPSEVVPAALKRIKPRGASGKPTKKQLEAERDLNEGILVVGYRTADMALTRYKRGVLDDPNAEAITHSSEDYQWIAGISQEALEHNGLNIAGALGPNQMAVIANGVWFAPPIMKIQAEAKRSPFQGRVGGAIGRLLERLPFIGKRIKERRMRNIEEEWGDDGN